MDNQNEKIEKIDVPVKKKKKRIKIKPLYVLIFCFLIVYVAMQGYLINRNKVETIKATEGFINDGILTQGIICRQEKLMTQEHQGAVYYHIENGQRVSRGMLIGEVYQTNSEIESLKKIILLEQESDNIKSAQSFMSSANVDISITRKQLNGSVIKIAQGLTLGDYKAVKETLPALTLSMNKINVATNKAGNLDQTRDNIANLIQEIKSSISAPVSQIFTDSSGYFISEIDGYENIASVQYFKEATQQDGENLILRPIKYQPQENHYGKIITDYKWNLCAYIENKDVEKLAIGQNIKLAIDFEQNQYGKAVVKEIIPFENKSLIILESTTMDDKSATQRVSNCEILFSQYKGIKIPKSALHIIDDQLGVYVKFSKLIQFKKVKPIFEDNNYMILPLEGDENNEVSLFDDVIVKGVNIYDGKYL